MLTNLGALLMPKEKFQEVLQNKSSTSVVADAYSKSSKQVAALLKPKTECTNVAHVTNPDAKA